MTAPIHLRLLRWGVPVAATAAVAVAASGAFTAQADPTLPPKTAGQLLVDLQGSSVAGLSGTVVQDSDLGLPELPSTGTDQGGSSLTSLLTGSHTLRVWSAGEDKQRIAMLSKLGETDVVRNGTDAWMWSSETNSATHLTLPAGKAGDQPDQLPTGVTPQRAAAAALAAIDPTTSVSTDGTRSVAGRDAYELVLAPKDGRSLVGQIRLAVDAETATPLRVEVYPRNTGGGPAVSIGYTSISYEVPSAEQFRFSPPPGAKVTEGTVPGRPAAVDKARAKDTATSVGSGWTRVLVLPGMTAEKTQADGVMGTLLAQLPTVQGSWGSGKLLQSTLLSALLTDDGRLIVGMVPPELLYAAAGK